MEKKLSIQWWRIKPHAAFKEKIKERQDVNPPVFTKAIPLIQQANNVEIFNKKWLNVLCVIAEQPFNLEVKVFTSLKSACPRNGDFNGTTHGNSKSRYSKYSTVYM